MANKMIILLLTMACYDVSLGADYNYNRSDPEKGPYGWANTFPDSCNGSKQSPIDIETNKTTYDSSLGQLTFTNFEASPGKVKIENNGISYYVYFTPNMYTVSGGGLPGTYHTLQIHLHWGSDSTKGSEHTIDRKKFPAELHFVNVNKKYSGAAEALENPDGIAALGVLFELGAENQALKPFFKYVSNVTDIKAISDVPMTQPLKALLPSNPNEFYRYQGSLTTPKCQEAVTWTVFKNYQTISEAQLNMLRSLKADNVTNLVDTYRPVMPLNSRVVKRSFGSPSSEGTGVHHVSNITMMIASVAMAIVMFK